MQEGDQAYTFNQHVRKNWMTLAC